MEVKYQLKINHHLKPELDVDQRRWVWNNLALVLKYRAPKHHHENIIKGLSYQNKKGGGDNVVKILTIPRVSFVQEDNPQIKTTITPLYSVVVYFILNLPSENQF